MVLRNSKGITLIELLAVIVILGIISAIAIPTMGNLVQLSKDRAIVGNALALKEAASFYVRDLQLHQKTPPTKITYQVLLDNNYIETFKDPDTSQHFSVENGSYVEYNNNEFTGVCLKGISRSICENDKAVPLNLITVESITSNKK